MVNVVCKLGLDVIVYYFESGVEVELGMFLFLQCYEVICEYVNQKVQVYYEKQVVKVQELFCEWVNWVDWFIVYVVEYLDGEQ